MCPLHVRQGQLQAASPPSEHWQRSVCRQSQAPDTLQCTEDPGGEGNLTLRNLSGLVQARRKLKNFPTKKFTSRGDKKQLRVINPCQHPGPRGQAGGQRVINVPVPRVRNARREVPGHQRAVLPHKVSGHRGPMGTRRCPPPPRQRLEGSCYPYATREQGPGEVADPDPLEPLLPSILPSDIFLGTQLRQVHRREANHQRRQCKQLAACFLN